MSIILLFCTGGLKAQDDYWQQFVHYKMDVTLLPVEHALVGDETILYRNNSPDTLYNIYLHLYPNAYKNSQTIKAQEARKFHRRLLKSEKDGGYLEIESFRIVANSEARNDHFSVTAFEIDDTILKAKLPAPLPPAGEITIQLSFYHKVRKHSSRAGYRGFQYDFGQWYPKVCVYDQDGWHAEPFHLIGEFYGEFGTFDVSISTPFEYIIGATGVVTDGDPGWEMVRVDTSLAEAERREQRKKTQEEIRAQSAEGNLRTVTFHAENVHDFAWVAGPDFLYEYGEWDGIPIHVLYRSSARNRWRGTVIQKSQRALAWLSEKFGRYPYPQLTVANGLLRGGMEYPMLVMNSSQGEKVILHEVGHIYFYGILANNELQEAWLDEGFTSFQTRWYMETRYGKWGFDRKTFLKKANWLQRRRPVKTNRETSRDALLAYMNSGHDEPLSRAAGKYNEPFSYMRNVYTKGAFFYDMLKYVVGDSTFDKICKTYFERWQFKHVNEARFKQVCEDVSGQDLGWFFEQWLHETPTIDYALGKVKKKKVGEGWRTEVPILRKADGRMPVEVQLITAAGDTLIQRWDGADKIGKVVFSTTSKPKKVLLDPGDAILDNSRSNNRGRTIEFMFDYPNMNYIPRDTYLVTWRPSGWYNEVDKFRFGGRLRASQGAARKSEIGLWYGSDSAELDGRVRYSNRVRALGFRTRGTLMAQKMEGRVEVDGHLTFFNSQYLRHAPQHQFVVGVNYSKLLGDGQDYVLREYDQKSDIVIPTWEAGDVYKAYFRYGVNPRGMSWFSNIVLGFDTSQRDWGSDFTFNAFWGEVKFSFPRDDEGLFFRAFGKKIGDSDKAPIQDLIFLDGANPREQFKKYYLRSHGSIPEEAHYHLPGGGNLRGYYNQPIIGDQVLALNVELRKKFDPPFYRRKLRKILGTLSMVVFSDIASMEFLNSEHEFFADAGLGLRFENFLPDQWYTIFTGGRWTTFRLDFPFWVNKPLPDESELRFRWVFGFEQAF
ncbi:M1 family metallopeptidase [candidate division KSB1 bacterium]|nr:M1 family metallopeptidase [candidate division KSB1 bacterium]